MYGAQTKFGIARQAAAGAGVTDATSFHALGFTSDDIGLDKGEMVSQNIIGRFEQGATYDGPANISGTLTFEATPRNLLAVLGAVVTHNPAVVSSGAALRTWTFLPNTQDFSGTLVKAPWTIYKQWTDAASAEHFYDCQFGQLSLTFAQGQFLRGTAQVVMGTRTATGVGSLGVVPDAADVGRLFPYNVSSVSLGGSALAGASEITISLNENIDALYALNGTLAPFKATRSALREVTVSGTFYMADRALLNDFVAGTKRRLLVYAANTYASIQSGYHDSLLVDIPQLKITQFKPGTSGPGEVSVSFTSRAELDPTSAYALQITLQNTYAANI